MNARDVALAVAVALVWGVNFVAMKAGLVALPPFLFAFLRFAAAAFPLILFYRRPAVPWRLLWAYALAQFTAQFALLFWGLRLGMPAGLSSTVIQAQAFFTIALAALFLREVPRVLHLVAAAIAAAGLAVIGWHVGASGVGAPLAGFVLVVLAGLAWACGNVLSRRMALAGEQPVDPLAIVTWASLLALLPLGLLTLVFEGPAEIAHALSIADWKSVGAVLFNAYAVTTFGFGAWSWLMRRHAATTVAPFALIVPVAGLVSSALLLGEPLPGWSLAAAALVLAGLAVNQVAGAPRPRRPTS
jgi:O-acetylserine/cysteine efflux transporter